MAVEEVLHPTPDSESPPDRRQTNAASTGHSPRHHSATHPMRAPPTLTTHGLHHINNSGLSRREKLSQLLHPSGKTFYIVASHQEVPNKRSAILAQEPKAHVDDFDVIVRGTDEYVDVIRDVHMYHTQSRDAILTGNEELLSKYDKVRADLDVLSKELHSLTGNAVSLDASFGKWGYSAHLRTHGEGGEGGDDGGESGSIHESEAEHKLRTLGNWKFWKEPVIRQYFHKGLLWRSPQSKEVVSFELFIDLVYVAVIDAIGEVAVSQASGASFLHYVIVFSIASKVFHDALTVMNWFEINDMFSRLGILYTVICLYAFSTNTEYFFETTYTAGVSFYLATRIFVALWFLFSAYVIQMVRPSLIYHASVALASVALWIGSIHMDYPQNLSLIVVANIIDTFGNSFYWPLAQSARKGKSLGKFADRLVEYLPAINIEHRVERTGAFTSLVIGYSVIKVFYQSRSANPIDAFLGKGILALIQAFVFNWIYFEIDAWGIELHAIRRHWFSTAIWNLAHIPFSAGFILAASTLSELVIAHDSINADIERLTDKYATASRAEVDITLRWFYCGGLGVAMISMALISLTHIHTQRPGTRIPKQFRLAYRSAVAIIIICLPLIHFEEHKFTSLDMIATTTALVVSCLVVDITGLVCPDDHFFEGAFTPERKRGTKYTAKCRISKKRQDAVRDAMLRGEKVDLDAVVGMNPDASPLDMSSTNDSETTLAAADWHNRNHAAGSY